MLRLFHALWLAVPAAMLGGCPVYSDGCVANADCDFGYRCDYPSGSCQPLGTPEGTDGPDRCRTDGDCEAGLVCDRYYRCVSEGDGAGAGGQSGGSAGGDGGTGG